MCYSMILVFFFKWKLKKKLEAEDVEMKEKHMDGKKPSHSKHMMGLS